MINKRNAFLYGLFLLPAALSAQQVYVDNNTAMTLVRGTRLVLNNTSFACNGSFYPDTSTVIFAGEAAGGTPAIGGAKQIGFYNLSISRTSGDVGLNGQVSVYKTLNMINGNLLLNGYNLDLGTTGVLAGEKEQSRVTGSGYIQASRVLNAPQSVNVGNLGAFISSTTVMGTTNVLRTHTPQALPGGASSIARSYMIFHYLDGEGRVATTSPSSIPGASFSVSFHYLNAELNGLSKTALNIWNNYIGTWTFLGKTKEDTAGNLITKSLLGSLSGTYNIGLPSGSGARAPKEEPMAQSAGSLQLFPNPAHDRCTLVLNAKNERNDVISLYGPSGNVLQQKHVQLHSGSNSIDWDLSSYAAGIYYLRSENNAFKSIMITRL